MNDIYITLTGNVASEPRQYTFEDGVRVTSLRVLTSHRYFDKKTGQWADGERVCFAVRCWRTLADNVAQSIRVGHPVVVSGKLRIREFGPENDRRFMPEVEASSVGHDLRWGTGLFSKPERGASIVSKERRERLDEDTQDWALGVASAPGMGDLASLAPAGVRPELEPVAVGAEEAVTAAAEQMAAPSREPAPSREAKGRQGAWRSRKAQAAAPADESAEVAVGGEPGEDTAADGDALVRVLGAAESDSGEPVEERVAA